MPSSLPAALVAVDAIPDTGPGLAGFLAHLLWLMYPRFPDGLDWLLLFLVFGSFVHFSYLPLLWRAVEADMKRLEARDVSTEGSQGSLWLVFWSLGWLLFAMWFFHTGAGQTFLTGRHVLGQALVEPTRTAFYVAAVVAFLAVAMALQTISERAKALGAAASQTQPFERCGFVEAWAGGGVFFVKSESQGVHKDAPSGVLEIQLILIVMLATFYWYWSTASVALMASFAVTLIIAEGARLAFVVIQHRQTFGTGRGTDRARVPAPTAAPIEPVPSTRATAPTVSDRAPSPLPQTIAATAPAQSVAPRPARHPGYQRALDLMTARDLAGAFKALGTVYPSYGEWTFDDDHREARRLLESAWCGTCRSPVREPSTDRISEYARFWQARCPRCNGPLELRAANTSQRPALS